MTHTSTEQPEALQLAETWQAKAQREASRQNSAYDVFGMGNTPESVDPLGASMAAELRRLHARVQELEVIRKAACKAYNAWAFADDIYGEVTQAMHAFADAINGITQEKQG